MITSSGATSSSARLRAARIEHTTPPARLTGVTAPSKAAGDDVRQHRAAQIARRRRGAHNSYRRGREDRPQRGDRGEMVALVDPLQHRRRRRDVKRDRQLTKRTPAPHGEAGALEHPQHRPVVEHHFRIEPGDPALRRDLRELLEHPSSGAAALKIVGHRKRDFGGARLAQPVKAGDRHHSAAVPGDQRDPINATRLRGCPRGDVGPTTAVKAQVTALLRQAVIELLDVVEVRRRRGLQAQRRPIAQQHVPNHRPRLASRSEHHSSLSALDRPHLPGDAIRRPTRRSTGPYEQFADGNPPRRDAPSRPLLISKQERAERTRLRDDRTRPCVP